MDLTRLGSRAELLRRYSASIFSRSTDHGNHTRAVQCSDDILLFDRGHPFLTGVNLILGVQDCGKTLSPSQGCVKNQSLQPASQIVLCTAEV